MTFSRRPSATEQLDAERGRVVDGFRTTAWPSELRDCDLGLADPRVVPCDRPHGAQEELVLNAVQLYDARRNQREETTAEARPFSAAYQRSIDRTCARVTDWMLGRRWDRARLVATGVRLGSWSADRADPNLLPIRCEVGARGRRLLPGGDLVGRSHHVDLVPVPTAGAI